MKRLIVIAALGLLTVAANAAQIIVPAAGAGSGVGNSSWQSDLMLHNAAPRPISISMSLHFGKQVIGPQQINLAAKQTQQLLDLVKSAFGIASGTGALVIDLEDRDTKYLAVTSRTYNVNTTTNSEYGQDIPAVRPENAPKAGDIAVLTNPSGATAGIFRFNFGAYAIEATTIRWELLRSDGAVVATKEVSYAAGEHMQHNQGVSNPDFLRAQPLRGDTLYARILSGRAVVYGSAINQSGDPSFVPANILREDVIVNFGVDLDEDGTIDLVDANEDGVLDQAVTVYTSLYPAYFRVVAESEFGDPVTLEVVQSEADAVFRDATGTLRVGAAGDLKNKSGSIVLRATSNGTVATFTIPVLFK